MLKDLVQGVRSIASIWTHMAWPATGLPRLRPFGTDKDVRTIYFIYGTVTRAIVDDAALYTLREMLAARAGEAAKGIEGKRKSSRACRRR